MTNEVADGTAGAPAAVLPVPRQGRAVNEQLRGLVLAAVLHEGLTGGAAARRFGLGRATVNRWVRQFRETGQVRAGGQGGSTARLERSRGLILRILVARPDISMYGLCDMLAAEGVKANPFTLQRFLKRHGLDRKSRRARRRGSGG